MSESRESAPAANQVFRVMLVQEPPVFLNLAATVQRAERIIGEAGEDGVRVVVFPETWLPGYPVWIDSAPGAAIWGAPGGRALFRLLRANSPTIPGPEIDRLASASARAGVHVVIGVHERLGGSLYNTMVFLSAAGRRRIHRKLVPTYTERLVWGQGDGSTLRALTTDVGVIGGLVCWEHWMPHARAVMHAQRELLHVAQWPWVREMHRVCSRQYAFEGRCWVAASGCTMSRAQVLEGFATLKVDEPEAEAILETIPGGDEDLLQRGGSCLIGPDGSVVAGPELDSAAAVVGEVDPSAVEEELMTLDSAGHYSRPDVFRLEVDTRARLGEDPLEPAAEREEP